jgi:putative flippase GtrA
MSSQAWPPAPPAPPDSSGAPPPPSPRTALSFSERILRWFITQNRVLRFVVVGVFNTGFGYAVFVALYLLTHQRQWSLVAATVIGMVFNFFTTGRIVFANRGLRTLPLFVLGYGLVLAANLLLLEGLVRVGASPILAQALSLPLVVVLSYAVNRYLVFGRALRQAGQKRGD